MGFSKQGSVAGDRQRRAAVGSEFGGDFAARGPAAAFEHLGEGKLGGIEAEPVAHKRGEAVKQRDGKRPPFDDRLLERIERAAQQVIIVRGERSAASERPSTSPTIV